MRLPRFTGACATALIGAVLIASGCTDEPGLAPESRSEAASSFSQAGDMQPLSEHVIVLSEEAAPGAPLLAAIGSLGGEVERRHDEIGVVTASGLSDAAAAALAARADVEHVNRDILVQWIPPREEILRGLREAPAAESDQSGASFFGSQWNMAQIRADDAWLVSGQGAGALVCILDTGVDPTHQDLAGKVDMARSIAFVPNVGSGPVWGDDNGHGTAVASQVTTNGLGMASVAPDARLCVVKVLGSEGSGSFGAVLNGAMHAASVGADVINASLGVHIPKDPAFLGLILAVERAVGFAVARGALVVASAGNAGLNLDQANVIHIPSQLLGVVSVGATGPTDQRASYSNFGQTGADVMAPGGDFVTSSILDGIIGACSSIALPAPFPDGCAGGNVYFLGLTGTSFAAPHASGEGAVVESSVPGDQGTIQLGSCIFAGAEPLDAVSRFGRINVLETVSLPLCGTALHTE